MDEMDAAAGLGPVEPQEPAQVLDRETPKPDPARQHLVSGIIEKVKLDKARWEKNAFRRIREDQRFAAGHQWPDAADGSPDERLYVANITLRHVQQRVAALYAKNPKIVSRVKPRLLGTVWDGSQSSVVQAYQVLQMAGAAGAVGPDPMTDNAMAVLQDAQAVTAQQQMLEKFSRTLELMAAHTLAEQVHPFKTMMKLVVRRAVTTGVGYLKIGFQRVLQPRPEIEAQIADVTQQMATLERLSADVADGVITDAGDARMEELRLLMANLHAQVNVLVREGVVFDFPSTTTIIPDRKCRQLREFLGCDHVTEEYVLTPDQVQEIYKVDVSKSFTAYREGSNGKFAPGNDGSSVGANGSDGKALRTNEASDVCVVWETYDRKSGLVYVTCDGFPDFLREPASPEVWTERFWPWHALVLNECDDPEDVYPPSDVRLLRHQQTEYNRLREGLREHRRQNRPLTLAATGVLSEDDKEVLKNRPSAALVELQGLQPSQRVEDVLQPAKFPGIDPNLYEVGGIFDDVLRTVGMQEANLGGTAGGTATESSIAESSRMSSLQSNIDDLDDFLTQVSRAVGQVLLGNVSADTVKEIVGPGAVWPELTRDQMAKELDLEIEAGSTGRPNQAQEIMNFERLAPILMAIPGIVPERFAKEAIRRLDDRLRVEELYDPNVPSINAMNQMAGQPPGGLQQNGGPDAPSSQGDQGSSNAQQPARQAGSPGGPPQEDIASRGGLS